MDKQDDYTADQNADEKKDQAPLKHLRTHDLKSANEEHGATRPRMNSIFNPTMDDNDEDDD